jgi:hypothetical protein
MLSKALLLQKTSTSCSVTASPQLQLATVAVTPLTAEETMAQFRLPYKLKEIRGNGWCGFRSIAHIIYGNEEQWESVAESIARFVIENEIYYETMLRWQMIDPHFMNQQGYQPDDPRRPSTWNNRLYAQALRRAMMLDFHQLTDENLMFDLLTHGAAISYIYNITLYAYQKTRNHWWCFNHGAANGYALVFYDDVALGNNCGNGGHYSVLQSQNLQFPPPIPVGNRLEHALFHIRHQLQPPTTAVPGYNFNNTFDPNHNFTYNID